MEQPLYHLEGVVHARAENLEDFDGPLDVILLLLSKNKIQIQDISITSILEQYLAYLEEMKRMDMEIASEFIAMASHLMYIKTKMLLSAAEQAEALTEMDILIRTLEERQRKEAYEQIRIGAAFLEEHNGIGLGLFTKTPEPPRKDAAYRYRHEPEDLTQAMAIMADRSKKQLPPILSGFSGIGRKDPYPVSKKASQLLKRLIGKGVSRFLQLFQGSRTRSELVATFLAVLELCRMEAIRLGEDRGYETKITYLKTPEELPTDEEVSADGAK